MHLRHRILLGLGFSSALALAIACGSSGEDSSFGSSGSSGSSGNSGASGTSGIKIFGGEGGMSSGSSGMSSGSSGGSCTAPVDMFVMFDRRAAWATTATSGRSTTSKWCRAINALSGYFKSMGAKDQSAALQFFPLTNHTTRCATAATSKRSSATRGRRRGSVPRAPQQRVRRAAELDEPDQGGGGNGFGTPTEAAIRGLT